MKVSAIIVAAGSSQRMGFDKLEADLGGESVLARSMMAFEATSSVFEFRVITSPDKFEAIGSLLTDLASISLLRLSKVELSVTSPFMLDCPVSAAEPILSRCMTGLARW